MTTKDVINSVLAFHDIDADIIELPFKFYRQIPKDLIGVYILIDENDRVMYVGKGNIADRQRKHWPKAHGDFGVRDPEGWRWLFENNTNTPSEWTIMYLVLYKQTELSAVEGSLIHKLVPLANNETHVDMERSL